MIPDMGALRRASNLVDEVMEAGEITVAGRNNLLRQVKLQPERFVDLVIAMAAMLADARPPDLPRDGETFGKYLRRAHAAYVRGERYEWVVVGEREYQRSKKQRQRERARTTMEGAA